MPEDETPETEPTSQEPEADQEAQDAEADDTPTGGTDQQEPTNDDGEVEEPQEDERDDAPQWALSEIRKLRAENAAKRTENKGLKAQLADAPKADDVSTLRQENTDLLRENIALTFGLPKALQDALKGDSREALEAHAKELQAFVPGGSYRDLGGGLDPSGNGNADDVQAALKRARARTGRI